MTASRVGYVVVHKASVNFLVFFSIYICLLHSLIYQKVGIADYSYTICSIRTINNFIVHFWLRRRE